MLFGSATAFLLQGIVDCGTSRVAKKLFIAYKVSLLQDRRTAYGGRFRPKGTTIKLVQQNEEASNKKRKREPTNKEKKLFFILSGLKK
jgi:hypothetical protein